MNTSAENDPKETVAVVKPAGSSALEGSDKTTKTIVSGIIIIIAFLAANAVGFYLLRDKIREEAKECDDLDDILERAGLSEAEKHRLSTMGLLGKCIRLQEANFNIDEW